MSDQATKRPWRVVHPTSAIADVLDGQDLIVARCGKNQAEQDAALIVEAVNAYDGLRAENQRMREALERCKEAMNAHMKRYGPTPNIVTAENIAAAALSLAQEA